FLFSLSLLLCLLFFFLILRPPPRSTLFPYTTLFRSCLVALKAAKILKDSQESFFRSASRTDRGVSAVGNVIAFNTHLPPEAVIRSEEHTSELQSRSDLVCRLLLEKKKKKNKIVVIYY